MATLSDTDPAALREALHELPDAKPALRLVVAIAYCDGVAVETLSDRYGVPASTIYGWLDRFESRPPAEAATDDDRPGRQSALSAAEREELATVLDSSPAEHGFDADEWTAALVREFVADRFDVTYSRVHAWRLLQALGPAD